MLEGLMYLSTLSIVLPILLGALFFKHLTRPLIVLYLFILSCGVFEVWAIILNIQGINNMFLFHPYTLVEFLFVSTIITLLLENRPIKYVILAITVVVGLYLFYSIFVSDLSILDSKNRIVESLILILYCFTFIVLALTKLQIPYLELNSYFILISGFLLYFLGTVFVFWLGDHLDEENFMPAWTIHSLLNISLNLTYFVVIWKSKRISST